MTPKEIKPAAEDPKLPWIPEALNPVLATERVAPVVAEAAGWREVPGVLAARLVRHKPGRRCVIEYEFGARAGAQAGPGVFAKMRAKGADRRTQELLEELRRAGLEHGAESRVAVPRPLGSLDAWNMTFQEAAPGRLLNEMLPEPDAESRMAQVAEALAALHQSGVAPERRHNLNDELEILRTRLDDAAERAPHWRARIERVRDGCTARAARLPEVGPAGLHRDFYPDQVMVDGPRTTLLDLDLYAGGDPALDVGNFSAHLAEIALRTRGDLRGYEALEGAFEARYLALAGAGHAQAIRTYRLLTLARHIQLSLILDGRAQTSEAILEACEEELG
ncbi:MAG: phosphotransferase [Myxococcota bacterium]|nr:phosphotransferase [Myxococcota bacterium]